MLDRISVKVIAIGLALLLFVAGYVAFSGDAGTKTVTAHFSRAVAVYKGTELRVMGVRIGEVTAVVPAGNNVRVEMVYDDAYELPAEASAAVVTATLVADRYVQVFPAYTKGEKLASGAVIPLERTQVPVELDRMYRSLSDISRTLGPTDGAVSGPLNNLLVAGSKALEGNGQAGSLAIRNLSAAMRTFSENRGPLFENVQALAGITQTLAANDATVDAVIRNLAGVSGQLAGERDELRDVVAALARVLGTVRGFVKENRAILLKDVRTLTSVLSRVDKEKAALALVAQKGALAMGNLALAFEPSTGTFGSRVQMGPAFENPAQLICGILMADGAPQEACDVIQSLLGPLVSGSGGGVPAGPPTPPRARQPVPAPTATVPSLPVLPGFLAPEPTGGSTGGLLELLGGGQ